jgi:hypothetical protein
MALYYHRNALTGQCDPSILMLCEDTEMSERGVQYGLRDLEKNNVIVITPRKNRTPLYAINDPSLWKRHVNSKQSNLTE